MMEIRSLLRNVNLAVILFTSGRIDGKKIGNPCTEGAEFALDVRDVLSKRVTPALEKLVNMTAAGCNQHELYQVVVGREKGAHLHLKRLRLAEGEMLGFLKDSDQVITCLLFFANWLTKYFSFFLGTLQQA